MKEADEDKFPEFLNSLRVSIHASYGSEDLYALSKLMSLSLARSFLVLSTDDELILSSLFSALILVRVLDVKDVSFLELPTEILQLGNLRFLAVS